MVRTIGDRLSNGYVKLVEGTPYWLWWIAPAFIIMAVVTLFPFFWLIYMSFQKIVLMPGKPDVFVGFKNWVDMYHDISVPHGWELLGMYVGVSMFLQMGLGLGIALLINRMKGEGFFSTFFLIPMMAAPVLVGHLWNLLLNSSYGIYAWILNTLGIFTKGSLLSFPKTALWALVVMDTWIWTPLVMLITLAGLKSVPSETIEAAKVDGSNRIQIFFNVTLPFITPALVIAFLLRFMDNIRDITTFIITTKGGPAEATKTIPVYLFLLSFRMFDIGLGSVIGFTILLVIIFSGIIVTTTLLKEREGQA
jgi:multiple sugar transport system permease protein